MSHQAPSPPVGKFGPRPWGRCPGEGGGGGLGRKPDVWIFGRLSAPLETVISRRTLETVIYPCTSPPTSVPAPLASGVHAQPQASEPSYAIPHVSSVVPHLRFPLYCTCYFVVISLLFQELKKSRGKGDRPTDRPSPTDHLTDRAHG